MDLEKFAVAFLRRNLILVIPLAVLGLRMLVRWVAREETKEIFRSVLSVPLDLMFIAVSLLLTGLARLNPRFAARYESDTEADLVGVLLLLILIVLAVIVTYAQRWSRILWEKFFAAWQQILGRTNQLELQWDPADFGVGARLVWMIGYWMAMVAFVSLQLLLPVGSLWYILRHLE